MRRLVLILALGACATAQPTDVDLITVACTVSDRGGAPVPNLTVSDFALTDNGQPRQVSQLWSASDLPLTLAFVADIGGNQAAAIDDHREAIAQFLKQTIGPRDRAVVVQLGRQAWLIADINAPRGGSSGAIDAAVARIGTHMGKQTNLVGPPCRIVRAPHSCGESALWHGIYHTAVKLKPVFGRKAIVVLSDGVDTGSDVTLTDAIDAAQAAGTAVYSIKYSGAGGITSIRTKVTETLSRGLDRVDRETGGMTFGDPGKKTAEVLAQIESDLHGMYVVGFTPAPEARDGKFHKLELRSVRGGSTIRARAGYWANRQ